MMNRFEKEIEAAQQRGITQLVIIIIAAVSSGIYMGSICAGIAFFGLEIAIWTA